MIYISSSCVKATRIKESIEQLYQAGFFNIELSGGTKLYNELEQDLIQLKKENNINFLCHNYFPPPQNNFVLNVASLNDEIYNKSVEHIFKAIELSSKIGAKKFAFHAGFLFDIPLNQIGKSISKADCFNKEQAKQKFISAIEKIIPYAKQKNIQLYVENNVISNQNFKNFEQTNPFFLCCKKDYKELLEPLKEINILIDLAHLKVSCNTLGLNFIEEASYLLTKTDYIHISDNNALADTNNEITEDSDIYQVLKNTKLKNKIITLEVYSRIEQVKKTHALINKLPHA